MSFGYTNEQSLLLGTPGGAVEVVALVACGYLGDRYRNRLLVCTSGLLVAILGMLLIACLPVSASTGRLVGYVSKHTPPPRVSLMTYTMGWISIWKTKHDD